MQEKSHEKIKNYTSRQLAILNYLLVIQNNKKEVRPSQERIYRKLGISKSSLNRDLKQIEADKVLWREKTKFGNTTIYHLADYFLDSAIRKVLAPFLYALHRVPFAALSLALLLSYCPTLNPAVDRDDTLLRFSYKDIKNKSFLYCKMVPSLYRLRFRDWLVFEQFDDEFMQDCIKSNKKNIAKAHNPFAYLMGICRQRADCFAIEPDITKSKWLIAADVLRENAASHVETQKTKSPQKRPMKPVYKDFGYNICEYGRDWGRVIKKKTMLDKKEEVLTQKYLDQWRRGHSPAVFIPEASQLTRREAIVEWNKGNEPIKEQKHLIFAEELQAYWNRCIKNRIEE